MQQELKKSSCDTIAPSVENTDRRNFLKELIAGAIALAVQPVHAAQNQPSIRFLRPPGSLPEKEFASQCIHCGQCSAVCPNRCIRYFGLENGFASMDTPYIIPREKACILCMKCGDICQVALSNLLNVHLNQSSVKYGWAKRWSTDSYACPGREKPVVFATAPVRWPMLRFVLAC
jgi:ferredoxin